MIDAYGNNVFFVNKLPVNAMVTQNEDGSHSIFINANLSYHQQMKSYLHELRHILNHDFEKADVQEIEYYTHLLDKGGEYYLDRKDKDGVPGGRTI